MPNTPAPLEEMDLSQPPRRPMRVESQIVINNIGPINVLESRVYFKLEISANWKDERLKGQVKDAAEAAARNVWMPKLNVFNREQDMTVSFSPIFLGDNDVCGLDITVDGAVKVQPDLRPFPFDKLQATVIIDGCDDYLHEGEIDLRLPPLDSIHKECFGADSYGAAGQLALKMNPDYDPQSFANEWLLMGVEVEEVASKWSRTYKRVFLRVDLLRQPLNHVYKAGFPIFILDVFNLGAFVTNPIEYNHDRLSYTATISLATAALLLTVGADIPKLPYLTRLDKLIFHAFGIQLITGLGTMAAGMCVRMLGEAWFETILRCDMWLGIVMSILSFIPFILFLLPDMIAFKRRAATGPKSSDTLAIPCTPNGEHGKVCRSKGGNPPPKAALPGASMRPLLASQD